MKKTLRFIVTIFIVFLASNSFSMDIGVMRSMDTSYSLEVFCENFERDVNAKDGLTGSPYNGIQDEKRTIVRFRYSPLKNWGITVEAGATDSEYSDGYAPIFGLGSHVVVYENNGFYTTLFAKATYAYDIEYKQEYEDSFLTFRSETNEEYWEYGAGVQLGQDWVPCSGARITAYTGASASFISAEQDFEFNYTFITPPENISFSDKTDIGDFEEDQPFMFFAGIEATLTQYEIGIRVESRFYDRTSFSVGVFKNF